LYCPPAQEDHVCVEGGELAEIWVQFDFPVNADYSMEKVTGADEVFETVDDVGEDMVGSPFSDMNMVLSKKGLISEQFKYLEKHVVKAQENKLVIDPFGKIETALSLKKDVMKRKNDRKKAGKFQGYRPAKTIFTCFSLSLAMPTFSDIWKNIGYLLPFITVFVSAIYFLCCFVYAEYFVELNEYEVWKAKIKNRKERKQLKEKHE